MYRVTIIRTLIVLTKCAYDYQVSTSKLLCAINVKQYRS